MTCFDNYIGLKGLCDGNDAVLYLEQCGITKEILKKANYTHDDIKTLLLDKINEATRVVSNQVRTAKNKMFLNPSGNLRNDSIGHPARTRASVNAKTGHWAGAKLELNRDSDYLKVNIDSISLFLTTTGNVSVRIYNLITGELLDTVTCASVAGELTYTDVNKTYRSEKSNLALAFVYDSEDASYRTTALPNQTCGGCSSKNLRQNKYVYASGVKYEDGADFLIANTKYEADTAGLKVNYTLDCDYDQWICRNRQLLLMSCLYYTAYHIAEYALMSPNFNSVTIDQRNTVEQIKEMNFSNFTNEFSAVLDSMVIPNNSDCFVCQRKSKSAITL